MNNYPPGVTGFEDHFGPSSEHEEYRECTSTADLQVVPVDVNLQAIAGDLYRAEKDRIVMSPFGQTIVPDYVNAVTDAVVRLNKAVRLLYSVEDWPCPFGGEVEVAYFSDHSEWTCPVCGHEYRNATDEPDPDREYEAMGDR